MSDLGVVITGVTGRMGSALVRGVRDGEGLKLAGATERAGSAAIGLDAGLATHLGPLEVPVVETLAQALGKHTHVVIDFTSPEASLGHAEVCAKAKVPPALASLMPPVSGLRHPTLRRLAFEKFVPANGPAEKISGFAGDSGSIS